MKENIEMIPMMPLPEMKGTWCSCEKFEQECHCPTISFEEHHKQMIEFLKSMSGLPIECSP